MYARCLMYCLNEIEYEIMMAARCLTNCLSVFVLRIGVEVLMSWCLGVVFFDVVVAWRG